MAQLREIKKRMGAVKTIQRITKTMQMIATAKFTASLARAKNSRAYTDTIRALVRQVSAHAGDVSHPLLGSGNRASGRDLVLVVSSDRGLCGAYNGTVLRTASKLIHELKGSGRTVQVEVAGRKGFAFFKFQRTEIAARHNVGDKPQFETVEKIAQSYLERFAAGEFDSVRVVYMRFISNARQRPEVMQLLPLTLPKGQEGEAAQGGATSAAQTAAQAAAQAKAGASQVYEFSPSPRELLDELLPRSVKVSLFQTFLDAVVSENVMRMVAMKSATDNAGGLGRTLKRSYNRARQARITTELNEIVSGAAALS
ncbi:MAG: ATP synthase F1 subunit gamma [Phycisphaerales bacterium]